MPNSLQKDTQLNRLKDTKNDNRLKTMMLMNIGLQIFTHANKSGGDSVKNLMFYALFLHEIFWHSTL